VVRVRLNLSVSNGHGDVGIGYNHGVCGKFGWFTVGKHRHASFVAFAAPVPTHADASISTRAHDLDQRYDYGCQVSGTLMINRVPGNFHIEAKSKSHNLNAAMTNLTHRVNHLSFGTTKSNSSNLVKSVLKQVPESLQKFSPIDDITYVTDKFHQVHHHYIKVVSTHIRMGRRKLPVMYQFLEQSQIVFYENKEIPKATFTFDLSPMSVIIGKKRRKWYDYLTSLSAIIGGTFTTLGLIDATLYKVFKPKAL